MMTSAKSTVAEIMMQKLKSLGVRRMFGIPGGGSSLDLIQAAARLGIDFHLTKREDAAVMMAAVTAELSGSPGVALATKGPGTANTTNGVAYAALDRATVVLFTDGFSPQLQSYVSHQVFDQKALLAPLTKGHGHLAGDDPAAEFDRLLTLAQRPPIGPVHIELTAPVARRQATDSTDPEMALEDQPTLTPQSEQAGSLLAAARHPVIVVGLEARDATVAKKIEKLVDQLNCPVLVTYKAKGVVADDHPNCLGIFTGGKAEQPCVSQADLIVLVGMDPVELILQPWAYEIPVVDIALTRHSPHYTIPDAGIYGPLDPALVWLLDFARRSDWGIGEIAALKHDMAARLAFPTAAPLNPQTVVEMAQASAPTRPRAAVDAGAHMISATAFWRALEPMDLLISNGLATMGFAVPAAIAAALEDPQRGAVAFTGDGGFMMCASELALAAQTGANVVIVVFNDGALSLIDIKQGSRGLSQIGTHWPRPNFAKVAQGYGCRAWRVDTAESYQTALHQAFAGEGPALIEERFTVVVVPPDARVRLDEFGNYEVTLSG
jgi:acetolactate synthase-1/2/3 large subunit